MRRRSSNLRGIVREAFNFKGTKEEQLWAALDQYLEALRWGRLQSYVTTWSGNDLVLYVRVNKSAFAQGRNERKSVCDPLRVALATWLAQFYGRDLTKTTEPNCLANGAARCTFRFEFTSRSRFRNLIR
jgi:predicted hydrocarbon binding protein